MVWSRGGFRTRFFRKWEKRKPSDGLSQHFPTHDALSGDGHGPGELVGNRRVRVDAEQVEGGGENVLGRERRFSDVAADGVAAADDAAVGEAAAGADAGV